MERDRSSFTEGENKRNKKGEIWVVERPVWLIWPTGRKHLCAREVRGVWKRRERPATNDSPDSFLTKHPNSGLQPSISNNDNIIILEVHRTFISSVVHFRLVGDCSYPNWTTFVPTTRVARHQDLNKKNWTLAACNSWHVHKCCLVTGMEYYSVNLFPQLPQGGEALGIWAFIGRGLCI